MNPPTAERNWQTIATRVSDPPLELAICPSAFRPNPTTVRFARAITIDPGDTVFDIGTGIGPLAIKAAKDGAARVIAVDPVPCHCKLARHNVAQHQLSHTIEIHQGRFFEPFESNPQLHGIKADVIIADVSGIADRAARALGWYGPDVPTGGPDGTDVLLQMLATAGHYLKPTGRLYFPIAVDLSNGDKVEAAARHHFQHLDNALTRPYVTFPLTDQDIHALHEAYPEGLPPYINIQSGSRPSWRGRILVARMPRSTSAAARPVFRE